MAIISGYVCLVLVMYGEGLRLGNTDQATCSEMSDRVFHYNDEVCGDQKYGISDLMVVFNVEQKYWSSMGKSNPWWAVLTNPKYKADKTGGISARNKLAFYQDGIDDANGAKKNFEKHDPQFKFDELDQKTALDFGCGLGRMGNALAHWGFKEVTCVDQSTEMLSQARTSITELAGQGAVIKDPNRIKFVQSAPDLNCVVKKESVDFVHSIITLQHMKSQLQVSYIEQFCDVLKKGGTGYFQMPTASHWHKDKNSHCDLKTESFKMMMHYTPKDEVEKHLKNRGCTLHSTWEEDMTGSHGADGSRVFLFKK